MKNKISKVAARQIAYHIANDLFTSGGGSGRRAARLVLEYDDGLDGGGWSFKCALARIEKHLLENNETLSPPPRSLRVGSNLSRGLESPHRKT